jgi:murein DD-endopeptidase MepM/ murein hydrolase activator NlpD
MKFLKFVRPCDTKVIRDDYSDHVKRGSNLPGLDYGCDTGDKIYATANGVVEIAETATNDTSGISITIKHPSGYRSYYFHLSKLLVKKGDRVKAGDLIAKSGNTGTTSTGPHLHFAIRNSSGKVIDPARWFAKNRQQEKALEAEAQAAQELLTAPTTPITEG